MFMCFFLFLEKFVQMKVYAHVLASIKRDFQTGILTLHAEKKLVGVNGSTPFCRLEGWQVDKACLLKKGI